MFSINRRFIKILNTNNYKLLAEKDYSADKRLNLSHLKIFMNMNSHELRVPPTEGKPLKFTVLAECSVTKARASIMELPHFKVDLPMFMPVGTQGTMKGLTPKQVVEAGAQIILGNTYHLGTRPGKDLLEEYGGLHDFMQWSRALLTDSGGFQMVSLLKLAEITEEGVKFQSPYDGSECMLTPEESIVIQNSIGADIMMQLDDVVDVRETNYERFEVAVDRTTRWLDRCMKANKNRQQQNLFPIVQGGLFPDLRKRSLKQLIQRDAPGYAIGGLSGGEDKNKFWPTVHLCTDHLPKNKPRYCMGVGFPVDLVVCCALGVDMFDCVYPTRTARFGCALVDGGQLNLKSQEFKFDFTPIDRNCLCFTCTNYTKAYLRTVVQKETVGCHLVSIHNIAYLMKLMKDIRESIIEGRFVTFVQEFMKRQYKGREVPQWVVDALKAVNVSIDEKSDTNRNDDEFFEDCDEKGDYLERMSGFKVSNYNRGYRSAILDKYEDIVEEGRLCGYRTAFNAFENDCSDLRKSKITPTWVLSEWLGVLTAMRSLRPAVASNNSLILSDLIKKIKCLLKKVTVPSDIIVEESYINFKSSLSEHEEQEIGVEQYHEFLLETQEIVSECKMFCKKANWKVPDYLE